MRLTLKRPIPAAPDSKAISRLGVAGFEPTASSSRTTATSEYGFLRHFTTVSEIHCSTTELLQRHRRFSNGRQKENVPVRVPDCSRGYASLTGDGLKSAGLSATSDSVVMESPRGTSGTNQGGADDPRQEGREQGQQDTEQPEVDESR